MGLDNGFVLRDSKTKEQIIELFSFRNYHELANFFRKTPMLPNTDGTEEPSYEYATNAELLTQLKLHIDPIYRELSVLPANTVDYYDENGYPAKYKKLFFGNEFDPTDSRSSFAGSKLMRLYHRIDALFELFANLEYDENKHLEIVFYDSY